MTLEAKALKAKIKKQTRARVSAKLHGKLGKLYSFNFEKPVENVVQPVSRTESVEPLLGASELDVLKRTVATEHHNRFTRHLLGKKNVRKESPVSSKFKKAQKALKEEKGKVVFDFSSRFDKAA